MHTYTYTYLLTYRTVRTGVLLNVVESSVPNSEI